MKRRTQVISAGSAVLIAAALWTPAAAAAGSDGVVDPHGPWSPERPQAAALDRAAGTDASDPLYRPRQADGFHRLTDDSLSTTVSEKLGDADTRLLQRAQASKEKSVTVLMLAHKGAADDVVAAVKKAGGSVGAVTEKLGYVRATVPTSSVTSLAAQPAVKAIDLDRTYKVPVPDIGIGGAKSKAGTRGGAPAAPGAGTPANNPYLPVNETGATAFVQDNPTWDGRGTVVGVLDTGVDVEHPALRQTSDGKPKIVDWFTATDPVSDGDGSWVRMRVERSGPTFAYGGKTWTAPAGDFEFGMFYESETSASDFAGDLDGDGDTKDAFGIIYDPVAHTIRVDADNDQDFTDEPAMQPYRVDGQVSHFGADDPATSVNERIPFVVEYRDDVDLSALGGTNVGKTASYVNIGLPVASHATHVAGIIAGTSMFDGAMQGAAPGAQIVSARACTWGGGCTQAALTEGMIELVTNRHVDVVNLSVGGLPALNDGSDVIAALYDELIDGYGVQIIVAAGNDGLGTNTVSSPSVASKAISVAASVSSATWWADYGAKVDADQGIFGFSSRGPAENGALAPQVAAPGAAISSIPTWLPGEAVPEAGYTLPAGYGMANGTSMAAPQVAGAAALLLSAAQASDVPVSPAALRTAFVGTAIPIPGVSTTAQGAGLIDTGAAWTQLRAGLSTQDLVVSAPVCSSLSEVLATPGSGAGVYNRCLPDAGGQVTGVDKTYKVHVTRTSGTSGTVVHRVGWIGNDGTFSARAALPMQRGKSADVTVTASAKTSGVHSAIMTIDDPGTVGIDQFVAVTVLATEALTAPSYSVTKSGTLGRTGTDSLLVAVPEGVEALQLTLDGVADGSQVRILPIDPDGMPADSNAGNHCYTHSTDPAGCTPTARPVYRPQPGVWEFVIEARRTSPTSENPYTATVSLQGMTFDPGTVTLPTATVNAPESVSTSGTNRFAPVRAHVADGEVGFQQDLWAPVADGDQTINQVDVPRRATRLDMTVTPREAGSDVDVYVIDVQGQLVGAGTTVGSGAERVVVDDPRPGSYYVVVAGVRSPTGTTTFDYHEELYSQGLGAITPTTTATVRLGSGESMPADVTVTLATRQLTGAPILGRVKVVNSYGTVIGAAGVRVTEVTMPQLDVQKWEAPFVGAELNERGEVAGDRQYDARMTPTIWTAADGFTNLGLVGGGEGSVLGLNNSRVGAGIYYTDAGGLEPAMWAADGTMSAIGLPDWRAYTEGFATGINDAGTVVGFADLRQKEDDGLWHSYREPYTYTAGGGFAHLAHLSGNPALTEPLAINAAGTVVGDSLTDDGYSHAVRWDSATGAVTDLGTLSGQVSATAQGINATGTVVGVSGDDAFVWTADGGMKRLPDYGFNASAEEVTDDGWVLGTVELAPYYEVSALWDPQGRLWDVSGMVPVDDGGWFLPTYSFGINNKHQLMVYGEGGRGSDDVSSTVLLSIPAGLGS
jgi:probable HAF family extracellular repeat protein